MDEAPVATAKETFDVLLDDLRGHKPGLFENVAKVTGFLLLVVGWLATSKDARFYFGSNPFIKYCFAAALLILGSMAAGACVMGHRSSLRMLDLMRGLKVMDTKYYEVFAIDKATLTICASGIAILTVFAAVFVASV